MPDTHFGKIDFEVRDSLILGHFKAMANPCVIMVEHNDTGLAEQAIATMAAEVWRIEKKYSRYRPDSSLSKINSAKGAPVPIDSETHSLLLLADVLWHESKGFFDLSSGVFRKLWTFDSNQKIPSDEKIAKVLHKVGWDRIQYNHTDITLPKGMQIDFGGIGKEYAADCCAALAPENIGSHVLVNLGGDIVAKGPRADNSSWQVGIEHKNGGGNVWKTVPLRGGAIATSGDVYKSVVINGQRYGHIINAKTGYPIFDAASTITVAAPNCSEAGMLTTLAILKGVSATDFLTKQKRPFWIQL